MASPSEESIYGGDLLNPSRRSLQSGSTNIKSALSNGNNSKQSPLPHRVHHQEREIQPNSNTLLEPTVVIGSPSQREAVRPTQPVRSIISNTPSDRDTIFRPARQVKSHTTHEWNHYEDDHEEDEEEWEGEEEEEEDEVALELDEHDTWKDKQVQSKWRTHPTKPYERAASIQSHQSPKKSQKMPHTQSSRSRVDSSSDYDLEKRLVIAIDYGTTFTGVALAVVPQTQRYAKLDEIKVIEDWGKNMSNTLKVPSAFSYTRVRTGEEQWGSNMSSNAVVMVHTKLELDEQDTKSDELDIILHHLDGMHDLNFSYVAKTNGRPDFSPKKPEQVVEDYLSKVFGKVMKYIEVDLGFEEVDRQRMPVDIVFTTPINWSYRAKNATYRAISSAGFNQKTFRRLQDVVMLSEPEAAAVYTARYLREKKDAVSLLKENDCFIICDAGGGTVDVVTFRVTHTEPTLEIEKVGIGRSAKCGSIFIDGEFKKWLRENVLGEADYDLLEPNTNGRIEAHSTTSEGMRSIIKQFTEHKKRFTGQEDDEEEFRIELPQQFKDLEIEPVVTEGELLMIREDMEWFFQEPLEQIVKLILEQCEFAKAYERRVKTIFMIGGFGESKYLQSKLTDAMAKRKITVYQPDTSWTAVVRGAAMHAIEKTRLRNQIKTESSPYSYGIAMDQEQIRGADNEAHQFQHPITGKTMARDVMIWIIHRGDLVLSSTLESPEVFLGFAFRQNGIKDFTVPIYQYLEDDDNLPICLRGAAHEMQKILEIPISFAKVDLDEVDPYAGPMGHYFHAIVTLRLVLVNGTLNAEVTWSNKVLYRSTNIPEPTTE